MLKFSKKSFLTILDKTIFQDTKNLFVQWADLKLSNVLMDGWMDGWSLFVFKPLNPFQSILGVFYNNTPSK